MKILHDTEVPNLMTVTMSREEHQCYVMGKVPGESEQAKRGGGIARTIADERELIMMTRNPELLEVRIVLTD